MSRKEKSLSGASEPELVKARKSGPQLMLTPKTLKTTNPKSDEAQKRAENKKNSQNKIDSLIKNIKTKRKDIIEAHVRKALELPEKTKVKIVLEDKRYWVWHNENADPNIGITTIALKENEYPDIENGYYITSFRIEIDRLPKSIRFEGFLSSTLPLRPDTPRKPNEQIELIRAFRLNKRLDEAPVEVIINSMADLKPFFS
jgi:hypothetical protein